MVTKKRKNNKLSRPQDFAPDNYFNGDGQTTDSLKYRKGS